MLTLTRVNFLLYQHFKRTQLTTAIPTELSSPSIQIKFHHCHPNATPIMKIPFRHSLSRFHAQNASKQSQPNVPLLREEVVENTRSTSRTENGHSRSSQGDEENMMAHGHDTMLDLIGQKVGDEDAAIQHCANNEQKAELLHFGSEQNMSSLQDLSNMLYTRGRLQELGCTFTAPGALLTYGHPATLHEFEQLLRLGPIYDEQWTLFFNREAVQHPDDGMWADMRTLKRVLTNEGVEFGQDHRRLTFGSGSLKQHRLCVAYDDLYKLWSAMLPKRTVAQPHREKEETPEDSNDDSGCFMEDYAEGDVEVETPVMDDLEHIQYESTPWDDRPRNIGWRFSDDIDEATAKRYRDSLSSGVEEIEVMETALAVAVAVPLPDEQSRPANPFKVLNSKASKESLKKLRAIEAAPPPTSLQPRRRYGPSPLQVSCGFSNKPSSERLIKPKAVTTINMVCLDGTKEDTPHEHPRGSGTVNASSSGDPSVKKPKKG
jgi:hypothetical protein